MAVKPPAKKAIARKKQTADQSPALTLRLPLDLREAITEEARVKGDLATIVLFALRHVDQKSVDIMRTRKAGLELTRPQLLHLGAEAKAALLKWAESEGVSVNAIVVSVLDVFFRGFKRSKALREELRLELRARRGYLPV